MKKLCVIFYFFISSLLFSSEKNNDFLKGLQYKALSKQWIHAFNRHEMLQERQSQVIDILKNSHIQGHSKNSMLQAAELRFFAIQSCKQDIQSINEQISSNLSVDTSKDRSIQSLLAQSLSVPLLTDLNSNAGSISSMANTFELESPKSRTSSTTEETISNVSVESFMPRLKESVQVPKIDPTSGITKFQARYRGNVLREDLSQLQAQAGYEKELRKINAQKLMQKHLDEVQLKKIEDQKKLVLEQQSANLKLKIQAQEEKRKQIAQNIENKKNEDEFVLQQAIEDQMLESLSHTQFSTVHELSSKDKKILKPLQKVIRDELFNSSHVDDNVIVDCLKPIVMNSLKKEGIDHQGLSSWILRSALQASRDGFEDCMQNCGPSFDGAQIFERMIQPSVGKERFYQLQTMNKDKDLQLSDGQIGTIMKIEKQLLLGSFALQHKNNALRRYILLTKNNK